MDKNMYYEHLNALKALSIDSDLPLDSNFLLAS